MNRRTATAAALISGAALAVFFFLSRNAPTSSQPVPETVPKEIPVEASDTTAMPNPGTSPLPVTSAAQVKAAILDQVLTSRNDNDPRLDTELRVLDDATKDLFRQKYQALPLESRNERGTIVFLLGRNLSSDRDFSFLCDVLREAPCNSLADCKANPANMSKEDYHHESGEDVTLAYPQYVAVSMLDRYLSGDGALREAAIRTARCGQDSRVEAVVEKSNALLGSISR